MNTIILELSPASTGEKDLYEAPNEKGINLEGEYYPKEEMDALIQKIRDDIGDYDQGLRHGDLYDAVQKIIARAESSGGGLKEHEYQVETIVEEINKVDPTITRQGTLLLMVQELIARSRTQEQEIEHYRKMEVHTRADILEALRELLQRSERMVSWLTWFLVGIPDFKPGDLGDDMREWKKISDGVENILNPPQPPTPDDMPF